MKKIREARISFDDLSREEKRSFLHSYANHPGVSSTFFYRNGGALTADIDGDLFRYYPEWDGWDFSPVHTAPRMTEVFVLREASMHAWSNLGYSPELKDYLEKMYGPDYSYDMAIAFLGLLAPENRTLDHIKHSITDTLAAAVPDGFFKHIKRSKKFRKALRSKAHELLRLSKSGNPEQAWEFLNGLALDNPPEAPKEYDKSKVFADLGDGWKWVVVPEGDCRGYEAQMMQHCGVADGEMYSLRDPNGKPHVTIELITDPDGVDSGPLHYDAGVAQCKGKQNAPPEKKYWPAIKAFWDKLPQSMRHFQEWDARWNGIRTYLGLPPIEDEVPDDERAFMGDMEPDPDCPDCGGHVPPGMTCPACGGVGQ